MKRVAYYKGCLASLSAKELDSATQALAPKVGLELVELESVTCCGAGDIHEAEPDYYLHLNARILSYAAAQGVVAAIKQTRFAIDLAVKGKVPPPVPPHVAKDVREARRLHDLVRDQGRNGYAGIVQGERALARLEHGHAGEESLEQIYARPGAFHRPYLPGEDAPVEGTE